MQVAEAHATVHGIASSAAHGYRDADGGVAFLIHTPAEVRTLLDCD